MVANTVWPAAASVLVVSRPKPLLVPVMMTFMETDSLDRVGGYDRFRVTTA